jgi:hypothetical protein
MVKIFEKGLDKKLSLERERLLLKKKIEIFFYG